MESSEHHCLYRKQVDELLGLVEFYRTRAEQNDAEISSLDSDLKNLKGQLETLNRHVFGRRSERMPSISESLRVEVSERPSSERAVIQEKRRANRAVKDELFEEVVDCSVSENEKVCPKCKGRQFSTLGSGKKTTQYDYIPGRLIKRTIVQQTLACRCGECILTAKAPSKVVEQGKYGAGFMTHIVVRKCCDQNPIYRLEKDFKRLGIPVARSTMNTLFHRSAEVLRPIARRILEKVSASEIVFADETPVRIQAKKKCRKGYAWTFISSDDVNNPDSATLVGYRFSDTRRGQTPVDVLGGSQGTLVVDAFTGYNHVTTPEGRQRAGCLAHVRRKFFDALGSAPVAEQALEHILEIYRIEHQALAKGIVGTKAHAQLRREQSKPLMDKLQKWLTEQQSLHPPKSQMGKAITYAKNNWDRITLFLDDVRLPPDNNIAERHLRPIAVGRKNWLFVGNPEAGENFCVLQTLVSTCEANGINTWEYLKDVMLRIGDHKAKNIDDLLPHKWVPQRPT